MIGVRPKSVSQTTSVVSKRPRLLEVGQQGRQSLIDGGHQVVLERIEIVLMRVPAAVGHRHEANARLDQTPGQQHALAEPVPAVRFAQPARFLVEIEGPSRFRSRDQVQGRAVVRVQGGEARGLGVDMPLQAIDRLKDSLPALLPIVVHGCRLGQVAGGESVGVRVRQNLEAVMDIAEDAGPTTAEPPVERVSQPARRGACVS